MTTIDPLLQLARARPLCDVLLICSQAPAASIPLFGQAVRGPVMFDFDGEFVLLEQVEGKCEIRSIRVSPTDWFKDQLEIDGGTIAVSLFDLFCYPAFQAPPFPLVSSIEGFREHKRDSSFSGLIIRMSNGASIGVDASHYDGLVFFLDGHAELFYARLDADSDIPSVLWRKPI